MSRWAEIWKGLLTGTREKPQSHLRSAQSRVPEAKQLIEQGNERLEAGDLEGALTLYGLACEADPASAEVWYRIGLACWRRDVAQAEYEADIALGLAPNFWPARVLLSNALFAQGEFELASAILDKAARAGGGDPSIRTQIASIASAQYGMRQEKLGFYARAELYLRDALHYDAGYATRYAMVAPDRFDPFLADVHHCLARVLQRRGEIDEARFRYRLARRVDPAVILDPMYRELMSDTELNSLRPKMSGQTSP